MTLIDSIFVVCIVVVFTCVLGGIAMELNRIATALERIERRGRP